MNKEKKLILRREYKVNCIFLDHVSILERSNLLLTLLKSLQGSRNHLDTGSFCTENVERKVRLTSAQYRFLLIEVS